MQAFLVTRQIIAGAGKFAIEAEDKFVSPGFQISQRSDFFSELQSVDTMQRRPIINTRDEPHANPKLYRRFHVIIGDANMSPFATWLKIGTTGVGAGSVGARSEAGLSETGGSAGGAGGHFARSDISAGKLSCEGARPTTALEVQRDYLPGGQRTVRSDPTPEKAQLVAEWEAVLNDLEADIMRCRDRLDWVAKLALVREFQAAQNLADDDPWLRSFDLEYHRLDFGEGLYYGLEQSGAMLGVPAEAAVRDAIKHPPLLARLCARANASRSLPRP